jgi:hypothetical protein
MEFGTLRLELLSLRSAIILHDTFLAACLVGGYNI